MENMTFAFFVAELLTLFGMMTPVWLNNHKIKKGQLCQLRSDMLAIYYHNKEDKKIRQYEYENFEMMYQAYKALGGNSFIDKIYGDVKGWEVIT